jgi:hypothetical protein
MPSSAKPKLQPVLFDLRCSICKDLLGHPPIKIPVPETLRWSAEESVIEFKVYNVCTKNACLNRAVQPLRTRVRAGNLKIEGLPGRLSPGTGGSE